MVVSCGEVPKVTLVAFVNEENASAPIACTPFGMKIVVKFGPPPPMPATTAAVISVTPPPGDHVLILYSCLLF